MFLRAVPLCNNSVWAETSKLLKPDYRVKSFENATCGDCDITAPLAQAYYQLRTVTTMAGISAQPKQPYTPKKSATVSKITLTLAKKRV